MPWGEIGWTLAIMLVAFSIGSCYGFIHVLRQFGSNSTTPLKTEDEELSQEQIAEMSRAAYAAASSAKNPIDLYFVMVGNRGRVSCLSPWQNRYPANIQIELIKFDCTFAPFLTNDSLRSSAQLASEILANRLQLLDNVSNLPGFYAEEKWSEAVADSHDKMWKIIRKKSE